MPSPLARRYPGRRGRLLLRLVFDRAADRSSSLGPRLAIVRGGADEQARETLCRIDPPHCDDQLRR